MFGGVLFLSYICNNKNKQQQNNRAMNLSDLMIEVTRVCNMSCDHCLRGTAENKKIDFKYIDSLLEQVDDYINHVTFTGGEPSLHVEAIEYFLIKAKEFSISIGSFYIATNGLKVNEDFVLVCLKLYAYCNDKEACSIAVSNDYYHQIEGRYTTELLEGLSFFNRKHNVEGYHYDGQEAINQGNYAEYFNDGRELEADTIETDEDFQEAEIYLNVKGDIVNGCNWSYLNQEDNVLCHVDDLLKFYEGLEK